VSARDQRRRDLRRAIARYAGVLFNCYADQVTLIEQTALLGTSAFLAGVVNSLAGGGTLLTYPALLASGMSPIHANATSTVCLVQGSLAAFWGYRGKLKGDRRLLALLALPCLVGAAVGAWVVLNLSNHAFALIVPWLILGATCLFLLADRLHRRWRGRPEVALTGRRLTVLLLVQLAVAVYGGFFGAGQGILMLATLGLSGMRDIDRMNGLKNFAAATINSIATILFVSGHLIEWRPALIMAAAAVVGGLVGSHGAQRVGDRIARRAVVVIGFVAAAVSFWKVLA
jgi:uncharacterized membrane protein YfcA